MCEIVPVPLDSVMYFLLKFQPRLQENIRIVTVKMQLNVLVAHSLGAI